MEPDQKRSFVRHRACLILGTLLNLALAAYVLPRLDHLRDIKDYRYVSASPLWIVLTVFLPTVIVLILLPVWRSPHLLVRWLAILLSLFPGCLAFSGWSQLVEVWLGG